jgi:hypothetical protein
VTSAWPSVSIKIRPDLTAKYSGGKVSGISIPLREIALYFDAVTHSAVRNTAYNMSALEERALLRNLKAAWNGGA